MLAITNICVKQVKLRLNRSKCEFCSMNRAFRWLLLFSALLSILTSAQPCVSQDRPSHSPVLEKGIVVESVTSGAEAQRAGLKPGDLLLSWSGSTAKGGFESPFDVPYLGFGQAPLGPLRIDGLRSGRKHAWLLRTIPWGLVTRPNFRDPILSAYLQAETLAHSGKVDEAVEGWRAAAVPAQGTPVWLSSWFLSHAGQALFLAHKMEASDQLYREAIQAATGSGAIVRGELFRQRASQLQVRADLANAEDYYRQELLEWREIDASLLVAKNLNELGALLITKGDFAGAESCLLESSSISEQLAPFSSQAALSYGNLAVLYQTQGDLGKAERYYRPALAVARKHFPNTYYLASLLTNFGILARWRGNMEEAEAYHKQALVIANKLDPLYLAGVLDNISDCRRDEGDLAGAEAYQKRALVIREKSDDRFSISRSLAALGNIARLQTRLDVATDYYRGALEIAGKMNPTPPESAIFLAGLGDVLRDRGSLPESEQQYRQALAMMDQLGARSFNRAETLVSLGAILRRQGHLDEAAELYRQALGDLEYQTASLGAEETQVRYRAKHAGYYREFIELLIEKGQTELAFETLESSRARSLFEMLAQAQINVRQGADPALLARERSLQQALNAKSQYRIRLLSEKHSRMQMDTLDRDIAALRESYQQVEADIRASSPAYAALTQPQPRGLKDIQALLDSSTVLVEYSLGDKRSYVWVAGDNSLTMRELAPRAEIESLTRSFYSALTARTNRTTGNGKFALTDWSKSDASAQELAIKLSRIILAPIADLIDGKRLLVVSDGALQYVPFAALPVPERKSVPLLAEHEIVDLPSASVLGEIRRAGTGRTRPTHEVAILADPVFDPSDERIGVQGQQPGIKTVSGRRTQGFVAPEALTRSAADIGLGKNGSLYFTRLLSTRLEAQKIMAVSSPRKSFAAVDFKASRKMAMDASLGDYRIVHFATHGLLDSKHPELSGLVFSLVDKQGRPVDGFVGLQDIYNLHLPADLVVLSACETALGADISGEGLIGLTRGFMYAGSSRVVASLWNISDEATSELMARFYRAMEVQGMAPAAALRRAQLQMWRQKRWNAPYYWAAFQIQGEWR